MDKLVGSHLHDVSASKYERHAGCSLLFLYSRKPTLCSHCLCYCLQYYLYHPHLFIGGFKPIKSWITFERLALFCAPIMCFFMVLNGWRYFTLGTTIDLVLLGSWALIWLTMILFWIYDYLGWTKKLWETKKIWFSKTMFYMLF